MAAFPAVRSPYGIRPTTPTILKIMIIQRKGAPMEPLSSLPARLFLLAYDLEQDRMQRAPRLGLALRAAALTELYREGWITDQDGRVQPADRRAPARAEASTPVTGASRAGGAAGGHQPASRPALGKRGGDMPDDPLAAEVLTQIRASSRPRSWKHWVEKDQNSAVALIRGRLAASRQIRVEQHKVLGIFPRTVVSLRDRVTARRLGREVAGVLGGGTPVSRLSPEQVDLVALAAAGEIGPLAAGRKRRAHKERISALSAACGPAVPALRAAVRNQKFGGSGTGTAAWYASAGGDGGGGDGGGGC